jgi:hypothetical protein
MKVVKYTNHLKLKLKIRRFPKDYPSIIFQSPEQEYLDIVEKKRIAIKRLKYNKKIRNIMIAYEETNGEVEIITIHPISDEKILDRKLSGRWTKNGN